jgi:hypothetical protein
VSRQGCHDRTLGHGLDDGLEIFRAGMQKQMNVCVDQAGKQGALPKVNDFSPGRSAHVLRDFRDSVAPDEHLSGHHHATTFDIKQSRGMQDNRARGWGLRACRAGQHQKEDE